MNATRTTTLGRAIWVGLAIVAAAGFPSATATTAAGQASDLPEGEAKPVIVRSCTNCHGLDVITSVKLPKAMWQDLVLEMQARGADLSDKEVPLVVDYLADHFGVKEGASATQTLFTARAFARARLAPTPSHLRERIE